MWPAAHLHLALRLRLNGAISSLPHLPLCCIQGQFYLYLYFTCFDPKGFANPPPAQNLHMVPMSKQLYTNTVRKLSPLMTQLQQSKLFYTQGFVWSRLFSSTSSECTIQCTCSVLSQINDTSHHFSYAEVCKGTVDDEMGRMQVTKFVTCCNTSAVTELVTSPIYTAQTLFLMTIH